MTVDPEEKIDYRSPAGDLLSHVEVWTPTSVDAARTALLAPAPAAAVALAAG